MNGKAEESLTIRIREAEKRWTTERRLAPFCDEDWKGKAFSVFGRFYVGLCADYLCDFHIFWNACFLRKIRSFVFLFKGQIAIPARIGWFLQEMPSFILPTFAVCWQLTVRSLPPVNAIVLLMFIAHYFQRSFVYPFLIKGGKAIPAHLFSLGFIFCTWNGLIQGFYHANCAVYSSDHFWTFGALIGLPLFVLGMFINIQSDQILRDLRKPNEIGYKIPHGAMFEFVSCANFFGEIVEWFGYALFAQSRVAWAFALFTAANTMPRAKEHHRWYLKHFSDYPKKRSAVIPFLY
ncbi:hypothetical protein niasHS_010786 [Heterodera schachtii]|uniref:3-oxo-5alpha-steroid 4-dehydrogenase (NADP(+)) n=1 Tax=Heterodera schachtii TaxID=97005 RepID=A0ABD2ISJ8_HETSC